MAFLPLQQPTVFHAPHLAEWVLLIALAAWVLGGMLAYGWKLKFGKVERYERVEREVGGLILNRFLMNAGYHALIPLSKPLLKAGVSPNSITWVGGMLSIGAGILTALGYPLGGACLVLLSVVGDALDGLVARSSGKQSKSGAFLDALFDRVGELALLIGIYFGTGQNWVAASLVFAGLSGNFLNSYVSAKAEGSQVKVPAGRMRRGERGAWMLLSILVPPLAAAHFGQSLVPVAIHWGCLAWLGLASNWSALNRARQLFQVLAPEANPAANASNAITP